MLRSSDIELIRRILIVAIVVGVPFWSWVWYSEKRCRSSESLGRGIPDHPRSLMERLQQHFARVTLNAARQGKAEAQFYIGKCYAEGIGVRQNDTDAARWFQAAAEKGYTEAQYEFALCLIDGQGVQKNEQEAVRWFSLLAEQGHARAQSCLADALYLGTGTPQDYAKAAKYYALAAEQGVMEAQYNLGLCYLKGHGVTQSYPKALELLRKAADNSGEAQIQCDYALCCQHCPEPDRNEAEAFRWFRRAARRGFPEAQYRLALCYLDGTGIPPHARKAAFWLKKAARHGHIYAQDDLGVCYLKGEGVSQDSKEAIRLFRASAEHGNAVAQMRLAFFYSQGEEVAKDVNEAYMWASLAQLCGQPDAQAFLKALTDTTTSDAAVLSHENQQQARNRAEELFSRIKDQQFLEQSEKTD